MQAQELDSLDFQESDELIIPLDSSEMHSVSRATWLSTFLPGAGQAYNGKYWKMPIIYGGIGYCGYLAYENHQLYRRYFDAFFQRIDSTQTDQYVGVYNERQLIELQNIYRDYRDLSIIVGALIWALNVVDAHVDAHLYYYNVNDNLSFKVEPTLLPIAGMQGIPAVGLRMQINLSPWK